MKRLVIRMYPMADSFLPARAQTLANSLTADAAVLAEYGFTLANVAQLQTLLSNFIDAGGDETYMGLMMSARLVRDAAHKALYKEMYRLAFKVESKWPDDLTKIIEFALEGNISQLNAQKLHSRGRLTAIALANNQAQMGVEYGITPQYVTDFNTKITDLGTAITDLDEAVNTRKYKTLERIMAGNELYQEMVKLCAIGKNYWELQANATKYDEYVLTTAQPAPVQVISLNLAPGQLKEIALKGLGANTNLIVENLSNQPIQQWFADALGSPIPPDSAVIAPHSTLNNQAGELGYDPLYPKYFVKNLGTSMAMGKITVRK